MKEQIKKLELKIAEMEKKMKEMETQIKKVSDTSYKTSAREIVNREVQFLQKVYDKSGNVVTEINAT